MLPLRRRAAYNGAGIERRGVGMLQPNELVNLALALLLAPMCMRAASRAALPARSWFYAGYLAMLCAYIFTLAEGFALGDVFNFLEHVSLCVGGLLFLRAVIALRAATAVGRR